MSNAVAGTLGLDPTLPDVTLILGGVERHLCFDFAAIRLAEKQIGASLFAGPIGDPDCNKVAGLLWAALVRENPKLTIAEVDGWITPRNQIAIWNALIMTWYGSVESDSEEPASTGEAKAQTTNV